MICKQCNREIPEGSKICPYCGTTVQEVQYQPVTGGTKRFCSNCGTEIPSQSRYCPNCGTDAGAPAVSTQQSYAATPAAAAPKATTVAGVLQEMCASPLAIIMLALYSLGIIFSIASSGGILSIISSLMTKIYGYSYYGYGSEISELIGMLDGVGVSYGVISAIPTIIMAIGLWLLWASARTGRPQTTGMTMIQVILTIQCVCSFISTGTYAILGIVLAVRIYEWAKGTAIGLMLLLWLVAGVYAVIGVFYLKSIKIVKTIKSSILTAVASDALSNFVGIVAMILGGASLLYGLVFLFLGSFSTFFNGLCSGGSSLLMALMLFTYRNRMQELMGKIVQYPRQ